MKRVGQVLSVDKLQELYDLVKHGELLPLNHDLLAKVYDLVKSRQESQAGQLSPGGRTARLCVALRVHQHSAPK
jgi:hypothetical protein